MTNSEAGSERAPAPMEGHGAYNRSSRVQAAGLASAIPLFREAAEIVPLAPAPEPVVIADYGCSEGHNSLLPMRAAIAALRQRIGPSRAISVVHTDLPSNDFSALFEALESDPDSYLRGETATFSSAVGRSFYRRLFPGVPGQYNGSPARRRSSQTKCRSPIAMMPTLAPPMPARPRKIGTPSSFTAPMSCGQAASWWCSPWPRPTTAISATGWSSTL
jgi:hypothetical protein